MGKPESTLPPKKEGDSSSSSKKKDRKGFKSDRLERFQQNRLKLQGKKKDNSKAKPAVVKEVKFDDAQRRDFLLGFHKRKNERRVTAYVDAKRKAKNENAKFRREQREEARKAYNAYANIPILPDYTYRIPSVTEAPPVDGEDAEALDDDAKARSSYSEHFFPQEGSHFVDTEGVSVTVQPLRPATAACRGGALPTHDFSDLPKSVADELKRLQKAEKGPAKTKAKVSTLKTLEKIRKIQKHCRKGHGKKGAKGKGK